MTEEQLEVLTLELFAALEYVMFGEDFSKSGARKALEDAMYIYSETYFP